MAKNKQAVAIKQQVVKLFTSESVTEGHPDKVCDQISDAIYDEMLKQDKKAHAGIECFATTGLVVVGGEARTKAYVDIQSVVRRTLKKIGYDKPEYGFCFWRGKSMKAKSVFSKGMEVSLLEVTSNLDKLDSRQS